MSPLKYTLVSNEDGSKNVTVFKPGEKPLAAHSTHPNWDLIKKGLDADDPKVTDLFDLALAAGQKFKHLTDRIMVANGEIYVDGDKMENEMTAQVVRFLSEGVDDWKPLVLFVENLLENPNDHSRAQLYRWIGEQKITITDDGMLVGYKGVKKGDDGTFYSVNSGMAFVDGEVINGPVPQKVGSIVEMPRTEVMHNPAADCAAGLHVGSYNYAKSFGDGTVLEIIINPRDVVSVPDAAWKLRTCRYKVAKAIKKEITKAVIQSPKSTVAKPTNGTKVTSLSDLRVGDVFEDTDKRRAGRTLKVKTLLPAAATVESSSGKKTEVAFDRLLSRKYKRIRRGRA